jgi:hypothetical protein
MAAGIISDVPPSTAAFMTILLTYQDQLVGILSLSSTRSFFLFFLLLLTLLILLTFLPWRAGRPFRRWL